MKESRESPPSTERGVGGEKGGAAHSVPENEIEIDFARSSGPGGQNVNKRATKAVLSWDIGASDAFDDRQKAMIIEALGNRINSEGRIVLSADAERSQERNRRDAIARLQKLVAEALKPKRERRKTRVSRKQKEMRREEKRQRGELKRLRKTIKDWD